MDVDKYAEMVSGCDRSVVYANGEQGGQQVVKSECTPPTAHSAAQTANDQRRRARACPLAACADEIHALHMHFTYFVTHMCVPQCNLRRSPPVDGTHAVAAARLRRVRSYDPAQRCMVFHLDYDRRSDLDDTVRPALVVHSEPLCMPLCMPLCVGRS